MSRKQYTGAQKFKIALEAIKGKQTIAELSLRYYGYVEQLKNRHQNEEIMPGPSH